MRDVFDLSLIDKKTPYGLFFIQQKFLTSPTTVRWIICNFIIYHYGLFWDHLLKPNNFLHILWSRSPSSVNICLWFIKDSFYVNDYADLLMGQCFFLFE